jgi:hypothetical protein
MRATLAALLLALTLPGAAAEAPKAPKKKRRAAPAAAPAKKKPARPARHRRRPPEAPRPTDPLAVTWPRRLAPGRWAPETADALERLLQFLGAGTTGYSTSDPPVAVLMLDGCAMTGSPGDALFARMSADAAFVFDDAFWRRMPAQYGGAAARGGWLSFKDQPRAVWPKDPNFLLYRKTLHRAYDRLCADAGPRACARWRASLMAGLEEGEVSRLAKTAVAEGLRRPVAPEPAGASPDDPAPAETRPALRVVPEMKDLARALLERGFDVWAFSLSGQTAALEAARLYGLHPSRVAGLRNKVVNGALTAETLHPTPEGYGLAEAVSLLLGRPPALAVGRPEDAALLDTDDGEGLRVLVSDPGAPAAAAGRAKGWVVQPPFSPVREPQEAVAPPPPGARPAPPPAPEASPEAEAAAGEP